MNITDFKEELAKLSIPITTHQMEQLQIYCDFLLEYNTHTNLTAIKTPEDVYLKHFYDSLTIIKSLDLNNKLSVLDIGSGAGFPGMVLKIFYPKLDVTLLDSNNKKTEFLLQLSLNLNLNVNVIHNRAEEFIKNKREYYDIVVSRAVASLPILTEISLPFVKINGYFIAMKGNAEAEIKDSFNSIKTCGGEILKTNTFKLPVEESERTIIVIKKVIKTNNLYPREYNQILKNPL